MSNLQVSHDQLSLLLEDPTNNLTSESIQEVHALMSLLIRARRVTYRIQTEKIDD